jgi:ribose transport system ATP-binding protein
LRRRLLPPGAIHAIVACGGEGMSETECFLELEDVSKSYGGVKALTGIKLRASGGSIHAILGENGAGKSTLMKILAGVVTPDTGLLRLADQTLRIASPTEAARHGIICIFQELSIVPHLTVAENICIANPPRNRLGLIDTGEQRRRARAALTSIGCGQDIDLDARCEALPLSKRQLVEIAKAVARKPRVLILDEATSALTASDVAPIMDLLRRLRDEGVCILFISHRMHEIETLADTCSVFRNGELVKTFGAGSLSPDEIVQLMIGRAISGIYPPKPTSPATAEPYIAIRDLSWGSQFRDISLSVRPGEIVGLGGLDGQGQRELLLAVAGLLRGVSGGVTIGGDPTLPASPRAAKAAPFSVAMIPEDRKSEGLFLTRSVRENLIATVMERLGGLFGLDAAKVDARAKSLVDMLQIKSESLDINVGTLSGGNQQKVVIAKWMATEPKLLLLMDPTRGIDVGTKQEIYRLFRQLAADGMAILLYSSDYDELIGLCDRALIMYGGRITTSLSGDALNEHNVLSNALNLTPTADTRRAGAELRLVEQTS